MKQTLKFIIATLLIKITYGQDGITAKLKDLSVPNSPAFNIVDLTPSVVQSANTPKEFILGVAQSYQQSSEGFPQNYSAEFSPYWWINSSGRNVYSVAGLRTTKDRNGRITSVGDENPFSGLKFTSVSLAFLSKDLIPDSLHTKQKIISLGIKTTIVRFHQKNYGNKLEASIKKWHSAAQEEFDNNREIQDKLARYNGDDEVAYQQKLLNEFKTERTGAIVKEITELINQKPLFSWDIAAAFATYGINDSIWRGGRSGVWTTISSFIPFALGDQSVFKNYFNANFICRYLFNRYQPSKQGITPEHNIDIGGKFALEFEKISVGVEFLYRFVNGESDTQNKSVGILNYRISDNLYLHGAFGKNFDMPDKLIALFGIKWGFGSESVSLPQ